MSTLKMCELHINTTKDLQNNLKIPKTPSKTPKTR